jgi:serine kinase of HPr protein (carbohydrate metabolism regulator)
MQIHGTCCADETGPAPRGVLLVGPPGSGKSDLALRLIDAGFALVADDRVDIAEVDGAAVASGPAALAGLIEVRGIGILRIPHVLARVPVVLVAALTPRVLQDRLPDPRTTDLAGLPVPTIGIDAEAASAVARIRLALSVLGGAAASRCGALGDRQGDAAWAERAR